MTRVLLQVLCLDGVPGGGEVASEEMIPAYLGLFLPQSEQ